MLRSHLESGSPDCISWCIEIKDVTKSWMKQVKLLSYLPGHSFLFVSFICASTSESSGSIKSEQKTDCVGHICEPTLENPRTSGSLTGFIAVERPAPSVLLRGHSLHLNSVLPLTSPGSWAGPSWFLSFQNMDHGYRLEI